jgi:2',3'-cyclic-nucleotide 2'-phosphodiesterase (5'-nucleotidase family)
VKRALVALLAIVLGLSASAVATQITVLYTNDLHVRLNRLDSLTQQIEAERDRSDALLLLDAGDTWQDFRTPLAAVRGADGMVEWMNAVRYDAMALGNHDFYWGGRRLDQLIGQADFPVLCANLRPIDGGSTAFSASTRLEKGDLTILVIGLTTPTYFPYADYPWLRFEDAAQCLTREFDAQDEPADLVVCLCHLPVGVARRLATQVPGIDLFVTGHSHETTPVPVRSGQSLIVQSGAFGRYIGRLVLDVEGPASPPSVITNDLLPTETAPVQGDRGPFRFAVAMLALALAAALTFF